MITLIGFLLFILGLTYGKRNELKLEYYLEDLKIFIIDIVDFLIKIFKKVKK